MALVPVVLAAALVVASCGGSDPSASSTTSSPSSTTASVDGATPVTGDLTVFAASSLTGAFTRIATDFEAANPGTAVTFNFAASSALAQQIAAGAPAGVFASADTKNMDPVAGPAGSTPQAFATNTLAVAVPAGNPARITGLADFGTASLRTGLCAVQVPCGKYAREALATAGVVPAPDTEEPDVKSLLAKVASGDLDAGIVYVTDVAAAAPEVEGVDVPAQDQVTATYPIVALDRGPGAPVADAFVAYVLGPGQKVLRAAGFGPP